MNVDDGPFRRARYHRLRQVGSHKSTRILIAAIIGGMLALTGSLVFRAREQTHRDDKLCGVLAGMIYRSGATIGTPGTPGYAYYQEHPDELQLARDQNKNFLAQLGCKPILPEGDAK